MVIAFMLNAGANVTWQRQANNGDALSKWFDESIVGKFLIIKHREIQIVIILCAHWWMNGNVLCKKDIPPTGAVLFVRTMDSRQRVRRVI